MKLPGVGPHSAWCQWRGRRSLPSAPLSGAVLRPAPPSSTSSTSVPGAASGRQCLAEALLICSQTDLLCLT